MPATAKPSAVEVGHEFVRQYYTLLNKDPGQVHRFYSKDSVFFHGGPANSRTIQHVVGQEEIYEQIEHLKFKDCRAKILQVDSQFTVGDSVVVQVCGEFSNNGEPTKKFVQTFVLVPEGLKKYHVRNDIFRYQEERFPDEVSDETGEGTNESEVDDETIDERPLENKSNNLNDLANHVTEQNSFEEEDPKISPMTNGSGDIDDEEMEKKEHVEPVEAELEEVVVEKPAGHEPVSSVYDKESQETLNNSDDTIIDSNADEVAAPVEAEIPNEGPHETEPQNEPEPEPEVEAEPEPEPEAVTEPEPEAEVEPESSGPVSWAALASKTPKANAQVSRSNESKKPTMVETSVKSPPGHQRMRDSASRGSTGSTSTLSKDNSRFNGRNAPDNCQVFIGNLPNGLTEKQVQDVFSKFGKIIEVRLNPKNFGFVIFDSPEPAEQVLKSLPVQINGQDINIEEKKPSGSLGRSGRVGASGNRGKLGGSGRGGGMNGRGGSGNKTSPVNSSSSSGGGRGGAGNNQRGTGGGAPNNPTGRGRHGKR